LSPLRRRSGSYNAALFSGILVSYQKKNTIMTMEMIRGAKTFALSQPSVDALVIAKMKRITALVRTDTPTISRPFALIIVGSRLARLVWFGMNGMHRSEIGMDMIVVNQNVQDHEAYWTNTDPRMIPSTAYNECQTGV
jgi:hypothetical protein